MSKSLKYLTVEAVKAIHSEVLAAHGGATGIRDETLLESAVAAPQASMMGQPLISDPLEIAAAYLFYISGNHPFLDGNKRTALAACLVFLEENGLLPNRKLPIDEWEQFVIDVASSRITRDETTRRLRKLLKKSRGRSWHTSRRHCSRFPARHAEAERRRVGSVRVAHNATATIS